MVSPGQGRRSGDVEFLATSDDPPRLTVCTILLDPWFGNPKSTRTPDQVDRCDILLVSHGAAMRLVEKKGSGEGVP